MSLYFCLVFFWGRNREGDLTSLWSCESNAPNSSPSTIFFNICHVTSSHDQQVTLYVAFIQYQKANHMFRKSRVRDKNEKIKETLWKLWVLGKMCP